MPLATEGFPSVEELDFSQCSQPGNLELQFFSLHDLQHGRVYQGHTQFADLA